jgi:hypothetical protein
MAPPKAIHTEIVQHHSKIYGPTWSKPPPISPEHSVLGDNVEIDFGQETRSGSGNTDLEDIVEEE